MLAEILDRHPGFRPPLQTGSLRVARLVDHCAAGLADLRDVAIRNRLVERLRGAGRGGVGVPDARASRRGAPRTSSSVVGFTHRKAEYAVGARAQRPRPRMHSRSARDDEVRAAITALRGLGPWTAEWFLARHLARPHAWPAGDLALRKAAESLYGVDVHELGPLLHPFENLSAHYLLAGIAACRDDPARDRGRRGRSARALGGVRARGAGAGRRAASRGTEEWRTRSTTFAAAASSSPRTTKALVGVARIEAPVHGVAHIQLVHVRARARRRASRRQLLAECVADAKARGARVVSTRGGRGEPRRGQRLAPSRLRTGHQLDGDAARPSSRQRLARDDAGGSSRGIDARADRRRGVGGARGRAVRAATRSAGRSTRRRAGFASPTRCSTATATRTRASRASSPSVSAPSPLRSRSKARSCASASTSAAGWSTSTCRCRRTTASSRKATSSRSRRIRHSSRD